MVDKDLSRTKLNHIATNLAILDGKAAITREAFVSDVDEQYVVLHALQLCMQAAIDLAAHIVADEGWATPSRSGESFRTMAEHGVISEPLAVKLMQMAAFRKLIVHEYGEIDLDTVFDIWHNALADLREFARLSTSYFSLS